MTGAQRALALTESPFCFENHPVRIIMIGGEPWFVATDICAALGIQNPTQTIAKLDSDERAMFNIGRQGHANIVNEPGMYTLVLRCRDAVKPGTAPHRFRKWVTGEVLPAIRKTGGYGMPRIDPAELLLSGQSDPISLPAEIMEPLNHRAWDLSYEAFLLIREHLRRRVAYCAFAGHPEKRLDHAKALSEIARGDLGEALAHSHLEKIQQALMYMDMASSAFNTLRDKFGEETRAFSK